MNEVNIEPSTPPPGHFSLEPQSLTQLPACCLETIQKHVTCNPMMMCSECRSLIKCFKDEVAYTNYIRFCSSRRREIIQERYLGYYVVSFKSYD